MRPPHCRTMLRRILSRRSLQYELRVVSEPPRLLISVPFYPAIPHNQRSTYSSSCVTWSTADTTATSLHQHRISEDQTSCLASEWGVPSKNGLTVVQSSDVGPLFLDSAVFAALQAWSNRSTELPRLLVVSGPPKSGRSVMLMKYIPRLLLRCGQGVSPPFAPAQLHVSCATMRCPPSDHSNAAADFAQKLLHEADMLARSWGSTLTYPSVPADILRCYTSKLDKLVRAASRRGCEVLLTLDDVEVRRTSVNGMIYC